MKDKMPYDLKFMLWSLGFVVGIFSIPFILGIITRIVVWSFIKGLEAV